MYLECRENKQINININKHNIVVRTELALVFGRSYSLGESCRNDREQTSFKKAVNS